MTELGKILLDIEIIFNKISLTHIVEQTDY